MSSTRVFEIRTYRSAPGKREALKRRFQDHTFGFFAKHGIEVVSFYESLDDEDCIVYVLAYPSPEAAESYWKSFAADEEWIATRAASEVDGKLTSEIESRHYRATEFSPQQ
jgi:hypothetical protein